MSLGAACITVIGGVLMSGIGTMAVIVGIHFMMLAFTVPRI